MNSDRGFVRAYNPELKLDFSLTGLVDVEGVGRETTWLFDRGGLSPNDLREMAGMPRINDPLLDQYFVSSGFVPIEVAGAAAPTDAQFGAPPTDPKEPKTPAAPDVNTADDSEKKPGKPSKTEKPEKPEKEKPAKMMESIVLEVKLPDAHAQRKTVKIRKTKDGFEMTDDPTI